MDCRFNRDRQTAMRNSSSPLFKGVLICDENLSISFLKKRTVRMKQSWAIGFSILEISKYIMQSLYHKEIMPVLGSGNVSIVMSDTDSFLLETKCVNETQIMKSLQHVMDLSNLPTTHPLFDNSRARVPGFLKNEVPDDTIMEAVALQSKTYGFSTSKGLVESRAKGVAKSAKKKISLSQYKACLEEITKLEVTQRTLQAKNHINLMLESKRIAFSSFDDKRYLLCPIHSVPYGSILIKEKSCYFCRHPDALY
jgi:hypothetical protein